MISTVNIEGQPIEVTNGGRKNARAWFTYNRDDPCDTSESQTGKSVEYIGLDESLGLIGDVIKGCVEADGASSETRKGKNVALLGFSQGGTFAHVLASLAESEVTSDASTDISVLGLFQRSIRRRKSQSITPSWTERSA